MSSAPVTTGIIAVTVGIHLLGWLWPPLRSELFERFALANWLVAEGEWWRMLTVTLLHAPGFMHVAFNMFALYNLGPQVEQGLGPLRFGLLWAACAVAGSAFSFLLGRSQRGCRGRLRRRFWAVGSVACCRCPPEAYPLGEASDEATGLLAAG